MLVCHLARVPRGMNRAASDPLRERDDRDRESLGWSRGTEHTAILRPPRQDPPPDRVDDGFTGTLRSPSSHRGAHTRYGARWRPRGPPPACRLPERPSGVCGHQDGSRGSTVRVEGGAGGWTGATCDPGASEPSLAHTFPLGQRPGLLPLSDTAQGHP